MESVSLPQHLQALKDQLSDASQANRKDTATLGDTLTTYVDYAAEYFHPKEKRLQLTPGDSPGWGLRWGT